MQEYQRTHHCSELRKEDIGKEVLLCGWVNRRRDHGGLIFIDLRDKRGITQLVFNPENTPKAHEEAQTLRSEWVIAAKGKVIPRSEGMANPNLPTGEIEIEISEFSILSKAKTPPFSIAEETIDVSEELRLRYRYLDMRRGKLLKNMALRHKAMLAVRSFLDKNAFTEVSTPILGKSTPEGARDYLVPSRVHPGQFYALPQSPQIFKQLLMVSGLEKYFQIAPCFRDEDLRADRQPEFTQIDLEMSFSTPENLQSLIEEMVQTVFKECIGVEIPKHFPIMTHEEAMESYGTDRPDVRFDLKLVRIDDIAEKSDFNAIKSQLPNGCVKAICVPNSDHLSRREIERFADFVSPFGLRGLAWLRHGEDGLSSNIAKFFSDELKNQLVDRVNSNPGSVILIAAGPEARVNQGLDHLRRHLAKMLGLIKENTYKFLWVTDFPLFEWDEEEKRLTSIHHPFTAPHPSDLKLMDSEPLKMRSVAYDLVLNGYEIGGGSQRIHDSELQKKIFEKLNLTNEEVEEKFGFFADALQFGTPPHLGIALGFDRLMMILLGTDNIRDVIAFPKTQKASDLMMECPAGVQKTQLDDLSIRIDRKEISWT